MSTCSLLALAQSEDRDYEREDYEGVQVRWCPGCGDHSVLTSTQKLFAEEGLKPEETVVVSGIGCSSRFPHYMNTYGFHGIHGRALTLATGVKLNRPELKVFVVMGDGDCCSIGAGHWLHATRYNVDMVAMLLDNEIYGLTKKQTSPTTPQGYKSNTQPRGSFLPALNPLEATLGITNASFVAQTAEWVPAHLYATLQAAYHHKGFSFVRILQRCPHFTADLMSDLVTDRDKVQLLTHDNGIKAAGLDKVFQNRQVHDPGNMDAARRLAEDTAYTRLGLFFRDESRPRYNDLRQTTRLTAEERVELLNEELARYAV